MTLNGEKAQLVVLSCDGQPARKIQRGPSVVRTDQCEDVFDVRAGDLLLRGRIGRIRVLRGDAVVMLRAGKAKRVPKDLTLQEGVFRAQGADA